jgi:hypothetical protein
MQVEEDPMEMRIVVPNVAGASALAERLAVAFGSDRISFGDERPEVDVRVEGELDPSVVRVVDAVERWFRQAGVGTVELCLGERSYRLAQWVPLEAWQ